MHLAAKISSTTRVLTRIMLLCNVGGQVLTDIRSRYAIYYHIESGIVQPTDNVGRLAWQFLLVLGYK